MSGISLRKIRETILTYFDSFSDNDYLLIICCRDLSFVIKGSNLVNTVALLASKYMVKIVFFNRQRK